MPHTGPLCTVCTRPSPELACGACGGTERSSACWGGGGTETSASGVGTWAVSWTGLPQFPQNLSSGCNPWPQFLQYLSSATTSSPGIPHPHPCMRLGPWGRRRGSRGVGVLPSRENAEIEHGLLVLHEFHVIEREREARGV